MGCGGDGGGGEVVLGKGPWVKGSLHHPRLSLPLSLLHLGLREEWGGVHHLAASLTLLLPSNAIL